MSDTYTDQEVYTIQDLNKLIKKSINETFDNQISIIGEIYNYKKAHNNIFASLRDKNASVNIVCFSKINYNINNGSQVIATGKIDYYSKNGNINFIVTSFKKDSEEFGEIYKIYESTKNKFENKGYFNNKKLRPNRINNIGIITSNNGAALQDILYVLKNNNFNGNIYIKDCLVQGESCHKSISSGIKYFNDNKDKNIDILLITRGGGSFDDLMGFSHDDVLEEIHKSKYYTISAVGHEIDFMLSDFVSDLRAPTPSIAAEIICSQQKEETDNMRILDHFTKMIKENIINKIKINKITLNKIENDMKYINPINKIRSIYEKMLDDMKMNIMNKINTNRNKLIVLESTLKTKDIKQKIDDGYCILFKDNKMIKDATEITKDNKYKLYINEEYKEIIFVS
jgi:exodeoxyribonuclease VII large subunit